MALGLQIRPQLAEILDDAVMDDGDALARMRVGVALGRLAMRRPAGVADAGRALQRLDRESGLQIAQLALGAAALDAAILQRGDAGGIVAAIFETLERIDDQPRDRAVTENSDDAAHAIRVRW